MIREGKSGRGGVIRTRDILLPKQALYRAEPRPDDFILPTAQRPGMSP